MSFLGRSKPALLLQGAQFYKDTQPPVAVYSGALPLLDGAQPNACFCCVQ